MLHLLVLEFQSIKQNLLVVFLDMSAVLNNLYLTSLDYRCMYKQHHRTYSHLYN